MDAKNEIIKCLSEMTGQYAEWQIFCDWVKVSAISVQNACCMIHDQTWADRERQFAEVMQRYSKEHQEMFSKMYMLLEIELHMEIYDVLGTVYMESGCANKSTGQFFSPFNISMAAAKTMSLELDERHMKMYEPSAGAGGMIIAVAKILNEKNINFQKKMKVLAQDLDWTSVYMCYLQLSLLGIDATVVQGDSLEDYKLRDIPKDRILYTPKRMGVLL